MCFRPLHGVADEHLGRRLAEKLEESQLLDALPEEVVVVEEHVVAVVGVHVGEVGLGNAEPVEFAFDVGVPVPSARPCREVPEGALGEAGAVLPASSAFEHLALPLALLLVIKSRFVGAFGHDPVVFGAGGFDVLVGDAYPEVGQNDAEVILAVPSSRYRGYGPGCDGAVGPYARELVIAHEYRCKRDPAVAAGASGLLDEAFKRARIVHVYREPHVRLVDSHPEGLGGYHQRLLVVLEA